MLIKEKKRDGGLISFGIFIGFCLITMMITLTLKEDLRRLKQERDIFKTQLRALLRASKYGNLHIMFPMVATLDEVREAKAVFLECKNELLQEGHKVSEDVKVGIMVEIPAVAILARRLLSKDNIRRFRRNEPFKLSPQLPLVIPSLVHIRFAVRRTGATSCPNRPVVGPPGKLQGVVPTGNPCEEVAPSESSKVRSLHISNVTLINLTVHNEASTNQLTEPSSSKTVNLVVVRFRHSLG